MIYESDIPHLQILATSKCSNSFSCLCRLSPSLSYSPSCEIAYMSSFSSLLLRFGSLFCLIVFNRYERNKHFNKKAMYFYKLTLKSLEVKYINKHIYKLYTVNFVDPVTSEWMFICTQSILIFKISQFDKSKSYKYLKRRMFMYISEMRLVYPTDNVMLKVIMTLHC